MEKSHRKAKITEETKAESSRLKELWDKHKTMSQVEFGEVYGVGSQGAMTQFLNGYTPISMKAAIGFAKGLGIDVADFSPRLAKEIIEISEAAPSDDDDYQAVKMLNVEVSAGSGAAGVEIIESLGALHFKRSYMSQHGINGNNSAIVSVRGESMEPTITNGAVVLINQNETSLKNGYVYALVLDADLIIKRLFFDSEKNKWVARSDNKKFEDRELNDSVTILGRAIWVGMSL